MATRGFIYSAFGTGKKVVSTGVQGVLRFLSIRVSDASVTPFATEIHIWMNGEGTESTDIDAELLFGTGAGAGTDTGAASSQARSPNYVGWFDSDATDYLLGWAQLLLPFDSKLEIQVTSPDTVKWFAEVVEF